MLIFLKLSFDLASVCGWVLFDLGSVRGWVAPTLLSNFDKWILPSVLSVPI